jgi:hypothetical protein
MSVSARTKLSTVTVSAAKIEPVIETMAMRNGKNGLAIFTMDP